MFRLTVIGDIGSRESASGQPLDDPTRRLLSVLVAWNGQPIPTAELAYELGVGPTALKNWLSRRRRILGADVFPRLSKGQPGYRLRVGRHDVDAWWLLDLAGQALDDQSDERLLSVLVPGEPFPGVPDTDTDRLGSARRAIRRAQRDLAIQAIRTDRRVIMAGIVPLVQELYDEDPYDEELAGASASLQAELFGRRHGLEALRHTRLQLLDAGLSPSPSLEQLERSLLEEAPALDEHQDVRAKVSITSTHEGRPSGLPVSLQELRANPYLSRSSFEVPSNATTNATWLLASGPPGVGKTSFAAEFGAEMFESGSHVVHLEPFRFGPEPWFSVFADALPDVAELVQELTAAQVDIAAFRHSVMLAVKANLDDMARSKQVAVIVTRAHRLPAEVIEALWYLVRSPMSARFTFLVAGDTYEENRSPANRLAAREISAAWSEFAQGLVESGRGHSAAVPLLDIDLLDQLVRQIHPSLGRNQAVQLAARISDSSNGIPGLALPLVRSLSPDPSQVMDLTADGSGSLDDLVSGLPDHGQTIGAIAAVLGLRFSADEVTAISSSPRDQVIEILTGLYRQGLIEVEPLVGHYRFATAAAAHAFLQTVLPEHQLIWHRRAAELLSSDPIRRARHMLAISEGPTAVAALLEAAEALVAQRQHHEAVATYERAINLSPTALPPSTLPGFVRALDLSGRHQEAQDARDAAVSDALAQNDHSTALALLLAPWPEAEGFTDPDGSVAGIEAINPDLLSADEKLLHATHWSRQLGLAGRRREATESLRAAALLATSPDDKLDVVLASRYVASTFSPPSRTLEILDEARPLVPRVAPNKRADYLVHLAIDAYEHGSVDRFESARRELWEVVDQASPVRRWHALLMDGVRSSEDDDYEAAASSRQAAFDHAIGHRLRHAIVVKLAGDLADRWLLGLPLQQDGQSIEWDDLSTLERSRPLVDAGLALVLETFGEHKQALALAEQAATEALARPNRLSAPSIALVAPVLAGSALDKLKRRSRDLLLARGDAMLVSGTFVIGLGPATRYAQYLEPDRSDRKALARRARNLAERVGSARWLRLTEGQS